MIAFRFSNAKVLKICLSSKLQSAVGYIVISLLSLQLRFRIFKTIIISVKEMS